MSNVGRQQLAGSLGEAWTTMKSVLKKQYLPYSLHSISMRAGRGKGLTLRSWTGYTRKVSLTIQRAKSNPYGSHRKGLSKVFGARRACLVGSRRMAANSSFDRTAFGVR